VRPAASGLTVTRIAPRTGSGGSRSQLLVRSTLVRTRSKYISLVGALARREGCRISTGGSDNFGVRVEAACLPAHVMRVIAPLLESLKMLNRQISDADAELEFWREDGVMTSSYLLR
jgi:transposase